MSELLIGLAASLATEGGKRWDAIKWLTPEKAMALRACAAIVSVLGTVLTAMASGDLSSLDMKTLLDQVVSAGESFMVATGFYTMFLKPKNS